MTTRPTAPRRHAPPAPPGPAAAGAPERRTGDAEGLGKVAAAALRRAARRFDPGRDPDFVAYATGVLADDIERHFRRRAAAAAGRPPSAAGPDDGDGTAGPGALLSPAPRLGDGPRA